MLYRYLGPTTDDIDSGKLVYIVKEDGCCIVITGDKIVDNINIPMSQLQEVYDRFTYMRFIELLLHCYNKSIN